MEFSSSSSDAELEEELTRNFRRERREQRGIVRAPSSVRSQARRLTLTDGHSIEVRSGCIYIPSRAAYVHVLQALRSPQRYFGDGRIPLRRRPPLSSDSVMLIKVAVTTRTAHPEGEISLAEATDNGFFVFKEVVEHDNAAQTSPSIVEEDNVVRRAPTTGEFTDPLVDARVQRVLHLREWRFALQHPNVLKEDRRDSWASSDVTLRSSEVCCYDSELGLLWKFDGRDATLYTVRYVCATASLSQVAFATLPMPPQRCLSMLYVPPDVTDGASSGATFALLILGVHNVAIAFFSVAAIRAGGDAEPLVTLSQVHLTSLRLSDVTCWSVPAHPVAAVMPDVWIGAGRSIFKFYRRGDGEPARTRVTSFSTTDVTALSAQSALSSHSCFAVAGMRNGTLQLVPDGVRYHTKFDTTVRHQGSNIAFVYPIPRTTYGFVSIARDGEAKVWDARLLNDNRDPVHTLLTSRPGGGQAGTCSASIAGDVLAVASGATGVTCVDLPLYRTLHHSSQSISSTTRVALGTTNRISYELFTFGPYFTQRVELWR